MMEIYAYVCFAATQLLYPTLLLLYLAMLLKMYGDLDLGFCRSLANIGLNSPPSSSLISSCQSLLQDPSFQHHQQLLILQQQQQEQQHLANLKGGAGGIMSQLDGVDLSLGEFSTNVGSGSGSGSGVGNLTLLMVLTPTLLRSVFSFLCWWCTSICFTLSLIGILFDRGSPPS
jgi:hypothetical protein